MNTNSVDKVKVKGKMLEIIREAMNKNIFASGDYIFVEAKKFEPKLTIWVSSKMISDFVKSGILLKTKVGNKFKYTLIEQTNTITNKDKYFSIIKKCHQIEENVLQLIEVESDGVKDLSDIVEELNKVVNKLN